MTNSNYRCSTQRYLNEYLAGKYCHFFRFLSSRADDNGTFGHYKSNNENVIKKQPTDDYHESG
ncbi:hypothetical protein DERP_010558 [Dermatophagoides pteronyssinus]|uniref:Uncharacterized protein n=1 Tax=Dermatophagoides pteronyssinus TaxID=6956 RepID=A0ABQ8JGG9_DERPT|nr:hypothetical protein DERP_010558 [Dermatophagoides pteronyssinus]